MIQYTASPATSSSDYFPLTVFSSSMRPIASDGISTHQHTDIQFSLILKGSAKFTIDKKEHLISKGQGIFINTGVLHAVTCSGTTPCTYVSFSVSPLLFSISGSMVEKKYTNIFFCAQSVPCIPLVEDHSWKGKILKRLRKLHRLDQQKQFAYELAFYENIYAIAHLLIENTEYYLTQIQTDSLVGNRSMELMLDFIHSNYREKISLSDIAKAGNLSRAECCRVFQRVTKVTPFSYLILHRINQSMILLMNTNLTITQIAMQVGFGSSSYYIQQFKREAQCTPKEFRLENTVGRINSQTDL